MHLPVRLVLSHSRLPLKLRVKVWGGDVEANKRASTFNRNLLLTLLDCSDRKWMYARRSCAGAARAVRSRVSAPSLCCGAPNLRYVYGQAASSPALRTRWTLPDGIRRLHTGVSLKSSTKDLCSSVSELQRLPVFMAQAEQIRLLDHPADFYNLLKKSIAKAERRIFLSSLYIGKEETELISHLHSALSSRPSLRLTILADALRSTRERPPSLSSASLLASLVRDFPDQVDVRLWHTPRLRHGGLLKWLLGSRFNEGAGLQHMKIYGFDDDVIISGANLSSDYFTNRRDRYVLFTSHVLLADFLNSLVLLVSRFSYALTVPPSVPAESAIPGCAISTSPYALVWDGGAGVRQRGTSTKHSPLEPRVPYRENDWVREAGQDVRNFVDSWRRRMVAETSQSSHEDTQVVPLLQMGPLGIEQETTAIPSVFGYLSSLTRQGKTSEGEPALMDLTSGYFSLYGPYKSLVLQSSRQQGSSASALASDSLRVRIITAAPESNGFFGSNGISGHLPAAYTWLERQFWEEVGRRGRRDTVEMREWKKEGWTYHAKGIWLTPPGLATPTHTLIGSSNYGGRSAALDLECTLLIGTQSAALQRRLGKEVAKLREDAVDVVNAALFERENRKVGWGVRIATWLIKSKL